MYQFKILFSSSGVLCYLVLFNVTSFAQWLIDDEGCRTPDQGVGNCIIARQCKALADFLRSAPKPISQEVKIELNKYTCGYDSQRNTYKVCCPSSPIIMKTKNDLEATPPPPPDITNHKNFNLLPEECGYLGTPDKITNGYDAKLFEFPWMALLSYNTAKGPQFLCGGTIINNKYILTAAHCISNLKNPLISVRVGEHKISTKIDCETQEKNNEICSPHPVQDVSIEEVIPHPGFNLTVVANDIGLIRVSQMNIEVENVRPVCLPTTEHTRNAKINNCIVTGWGFTETGYTSDVLQRVDLPIMNLTQCSNAYKEDEKVKLTYKQICAGGKNQQDSCRGDSGGPMHVPAFLNDDTRYVQQGVVSFGYKICGTEGYPGVYTRVAYFMDWILDNMKP